MEWYNQGKYFKAIPVFEELMGLLKGKESVEEIYFHYCMANFKQESYLMSAYHFKHYYNKHPYSKYAEEALFMHAKSYEEQSLIFSLDQTETVKAIDAFQTYINTYPNSENVKEANDVIEKLRNTLEKKAISAADLYYKTKNYRAAAVSYKNLLLDYPDIDNVKQIQFKTVESYSKYAEQSIASKQKERYEEAIKTASNYLNRYPNSEFKFKVNKLKENAHYNVLKSNYDHAMYSSYSTKISLLNEMDDLFAMHYTKIQDPILKQKADNYIEKAYFQKLKEEYSQAQDSKLEEKSIYYKKAIEAYNIFNTKFSGSRYNNEAKRLFLASEKNFKKYTK